jgi:hypothetical protein
VNWSATAGDSMTTMLSAFSSALSQKLSPPVTTTRASTTAHLIFSIEDLVEFVTFVMTLEPGDIISTGTPAGVGVFRDPPVYLEPGDRARVEIEGVGSVENPVVDWSDVEDGDRGGPERADDRAGPAPESE